MSIFDKSKPFPGNLSPASNQNRPLMTRLPADQLRYPVAVYRRGEDIFCPLGVATAFGGPLDRLDDGNTASGISTKRPGGYVGCSLPMPAARGCIGTPFPQLPWKTGVLVTLGQRTVNLPLIDEGPSGGLKSQAIIDITFEGWEELLGKSLDPHMVNTLSQRVSFVIPAVGRFLADYQPHVPRAEGFADQG